MILGLRSNLIISCLDSVMFLFLLKNIYLRTFVTRFSTVNYGTYSIEVLCQYDILWRKAVWRLWHLPYPTHCNLYLRHLLSEIICVLFYIGPNRFVNFSRDCLSSSNVHIKFVSLLAAVSQMHVFGKNFFICQIWFCLLCHHLPLLHVNFVLWS